MSMEHGLVPVVATNGQNVGTKPFIIHFHLPVLRVESESDDVPRKQKGRISAAPNESSQIVTVSG